MANNSGYFLKGLSSGLQSGINMGQQIQEMQWQKAQRKKLEEKEKQIKESMYTIGNLFKQYGADNAYSDDEIMQLNVALSAAVPEVQAVYKDSVNAIQTMNKRKFEEDLQWFDLFISQAEGLNPGDVQGIFDMAKSRFQTDKAKNYFTAYESIQKKKYEAAQIPKEVSPYEFYSGSPASVQSQTAESVAGQTKGLEGMQFKQPTVIEQPQTELDKSTYQNKMLDSFKRRNDREGFNLFAKANGLNVNFDTYGQEVKPAGGGTEKPRATSLSQLEEYRNKALDADTWEDAEKVINDYTQAGYDTSQLGITKEAWANSQTNYLTTVKRAIDNIVDEKGNLKKGTFTKDQVGLEFDGSKKSEDIYKKLFESYMKVRDILEKMGIDVSEFPKLKTIEEMNKGGFWQKLLERGKYYKP